MAGALVACHTGDGLSELSWQTLLSSTPGLKAFTQEETTMRTCELRVYSLRTNEALDFYRQMIYPRHLNSFARFEIEAHGFCTAAADVEPRLFVLASCAAGE